jgi:hypothetical protein
MWHLEKYKFQGKIELDMNHQLAIAYCERMTLFVTQISGFCCFFFFQIGSHAKFARAGLNHDPPTSSSRVPAIASVYTTTTSLSLTWGRSH